MNGPKPMSTDPPDPTTPPTNPTSRPSVPTVPPRSPPELTLSTVIIAAALFLFACVPYGLMLCLLIPPVMRRSSSGHAAWWEVFGAFILFPLSLFSTVYALGLYERADSISGHCRAAAGRGAVLAHAHGRSYTSTETVMNYCGVESFITHWRQESRRYRRPERQIERIIQRLFTNATR